MKPFIHENFLLNNKKAEKLYHDFSEGQPVIDFHCHLSPTLIATDHTFSDITRAWLDGDHYKWRAMRMNGIDEQYCTGDAPSIEKFRKWAATVPDTAGNPLYHWTHLELSRYFGITDLLSPSNAADVYEKTSALLQEKELSTRSVLRKMKVELVCTTDDPADNLFHHLAMKDDFEIRVLPAFRPDNIIKTVDTEAFRNYITRLEEAAGMQITDFDLLLDAIERRHSFFHAAGCRISDHGMDRFYFSEYSPGEIGKIFKKLLEKKSISADENEKYITAVMLGLCKMNHKRGWIQQLHIGAIRNNNSRMFRIMGADTGWDSIGPSQDPSKMSGFLNALDNEDKLAKTILYNLNPSDNEMFITMAGNFNDGSSPAKVQYGAAWWFLDQKTGIEKHLRDLGSMGLLRRFVGMVTDSRSFLSYPRHEYFRRLLCNYIGEEVEQGNIPDDNGILKPLIEGISYTNAKEYFGF